MASIYLPIRSYGDFVITASVVEHNFEQRIPIALPDYFKELFMALGGDRLFDVIATLPYSNQPAFFEMYKVKDAKNAKRLLRDFNILKQALTKDDYLLDYRSRRISFLSGRFQWPADNINIYQAKADLFAKNGLIKPLLDASGINTKQPIKNVAILPDSRVADKALKPELISQLADNLNGCRVSIARFGTQTLSQGSTDVCYGNFEELIALINASDLVISAESLPYHLAYYAQKPHYVIYNLSRHFKSTFMTPYMIQYQASSVFDGGNTQDIINAVNSFISNYK